MADRIVLIQMAARRAQNRKASTKRQDRLRAEGKCINGDGNPVHRGGRCESCWAKKLAAARVVLPTAAAAAPGVVYRRDASWTVKQGPAAAWHWPHPADAAMSACGRYVLLQGPSDGRAAADVAAHARCQGAGCRQRWERWGGGHV
jgi:hypothetical protein